jgi:hypothetical protein
MAHCRKAPAGSISTYMRTLSIAAAGVCLAATLSAQTAPPPADSFKTNYYANANTTGVPDSTVRITNVGTQVASSAVPSGLLCALIYVLTPDQQLSECCACPVSPDALLTLSVNNDLTSNPLTSAVLTNGDVKIVSSTTCNAALPAPASGIQAWATHMQTTVQSETDFKDAPLSTGELNNLAGKCAAIQANGDGNGICTCGTGE